MLSPSFIVSGFTFKSNPSRLCEWYMVVVQFHSFAFGYAVFPFIEETVLFLSCVLGTLIKN